MRSLTLLLALGLLVGILTACGSSRPQGVSFHSASGHYTVRQVEAAFAAQGIQLRLAHEQIPGYFVLHGGRTPPKSVAVLVKLSSGPAGTGDSLTGGQRLRRGNIWVSFDSPNAEAVKNALARLD
jgi:hypothetical protein